MSLLAGQNISYHLISENIFKLSTEIKKDRSNILLITQPRHSKQPELEMKSLFI